MFIDCHAHLIFPSFPAEVYDMEIEGEFPTSTKESIKKRIDEAKNKQVKHIVSVLSAPPVFSKYSLQIGFDSIIHVLGIQRGKAMENHSQLLSLLQNEIDRHKPHAIGEIGLEYESGHEDLSKSDSLLFKRKQQELFRKQIRLAKELNLPVVIHSGFGTDNDLISILNEERAEDIGGQIHCYRNKPDSLKELLNMGFYLSFGREHTIEDKLQQIVKKTPVERTLTETDSPYRLIGEPPRFIAPKDVAQIARRLADIREIEVNEFANQVLRNAQELYKF
jgi:TatD DNase family protein